jgi:hypothetical protein
LGFSPSYDPGTAYYDIPLQDLWGPGGNAFDIGGAGIFNSIGLGGAGYDSGGYGYANFGGSATDGGGWGGSLTADYNGGRGQ